MLNDETLSPCLGFRFSEGLSEVKKNTGHVQNKRERERGEEAEFVGADTPPSAASSKSPSTSSHFLLCSPFMTDTRIHAQIKRGAIMG